MRNLLHRSRAGRGVVAAVVVGAMIVLAQLVVWQEQQPRWLGLRAVQDGQHLVLSSVQLGSWAWDSGARPGQIVIAINGRPVTDGDGPELVNAADSALLQTATGASILVSHHGSPAASVSEGQRRLHDAITAAFVAISCIVFILAADVLAASALLILAMSVGVMFEAAGAQHTGVPWSFHLVHAAVPTMGLSALLFFLQFPINRLRNWWGRVLLYAAIGAYIVQMGMLVWLLNFGTGFELFKALVFLMLSVQTCAVIALVIAAMMGASPERREARRTLAVVAIGSTLAMAPLGFLSVLPSLVLGTAIVPASVTVLTLGLMPACLGVAVLSRQFLGIQRLIRRGLVTVLVWTGLLTIYTIIWRLPILQPTADGMGELVTGLKLAVALGTFPLLQARVGSLLERILFRDVYEYSATLARFGNQIVHETGVDTIANYTLSELARTLDLTWAAIALRGTETEPLLIFRWGAPPSEFTPEHVERAIDLSGHLTYGSESAHLTPLVVEGNRVGVLLVGPKRQDIELLAEDEVLLTSLAPIVATALDHALLVLRLEAQVAVLAQRERDLASLNARLVQVQEEERRKLALDLHDDPLQRAAMLHRRLGALERELPEVPDLDVCRESAELIEVGLRAICVGLRPRMLDDLGLEAAAQWLVRDVRARSDLEIELDVSTTDGEPFGRLDPDLEIGLYRVAQEALNNAVKHARATQVVVVLVREADAIRLRVVDDGQGLQDGPSATSLGLLGMRERLAAWNAAVSIENEPHGGVVVSANVPIRAPATGLDLAA